MIKYDKALFRNDIQQVDWEAILTALSDNPADMASTFQEVFESILDLHALLRRRRVRNEFAPWLTPSLRALMFERDRLQVEAGKSPETWSV